MLKVPEVSLPIKSNFAKVNRLPSGGDNGLKSMRNKYILWMICSFTKFMFGKLIPNKKGNIILKAMNST